MSFLAVDIGATNIRVASGDPSGLRSRLSEGTDRGNGPLGVSAQIIRMAHELGMGSVESVGVGSIGPIDISSGSIVDTPNFPFKEIPVTGPLREEFHAPVSLLNDCAAAVLGERRFGAGRGLDNLAYVTLSTGLGGGAIVDGHLLIGKDGNAVEVGHITIDPGSPLICGCGSPGHWEAHSSGSSIPSFVRRSLREEDKGSSLYMLAGGGLEELNAEALFGAAKAGDATALRIVEELGKVNAVGFANVVNAFDPELITIGGSIALNNPELILEPILENIGRHLLNREPRIMITPLGEDVVLYGAVSRAISLL
ncbi:MAG: ROK family protein [Candidatus Bathyarchaeia archaeon]